MGNEKWGKEEGVERMGTYEGERGRERERRRDVY